MTGWLNKWAWWGGFSDVLVVVVVLFGGVGGGGGGGCVGVCSSGCGCSLPHTLI